MDPLRIWIYKQVFSTIITYISSIMRFTRVHINKMFTGQMDGHNLVGDTYIPGTDTYDNTTVTTQTDYPVHQQQRPYHRLQS